MPKAVWTSDDVTITTLDPLLIHFPSPPSRLDRRGCCAKTSYEDTPHEDETGCVILAEDYDGISRGVRDRGNLECVIRSGVREQESATCLTFAWVDRRPVGPSVWTTYPGVHSLLLDMWTIRSIHQESFE